MLKKLPLEEIDGTKNALLFLLRAPAFHIFTFNFIFNFFLLLYELKHNIRLSKTMSGIFNFDPVLLLLKLITNDFKTS